MSIQQAEIELSSSRKHSCAATDVFLQFPSPPSKITVASPDSVKRRRAINSRSSRKSLWLICRIEVSILPGYCYRAVPCRGHVVEGSHRSVPHPPSSSEQASAQISYSGGVTFSQQNSKVRKRRSMLHRVNL